MKKVTIILFVTILIISITGSIESIAAERDSEYIVHIQVEVRNAQEHLVSITESNLVNI